MNVIIDSLHLPSSPASKPPRFDMYAFIHKGLRHHMNGALHALGAVDLEDAAAFEGVLVRVDGLLSELRHHLKHENDFLHTAIEARRPGGARHTADDHVEHIDAIANLEDESRSLRAARAEQRPALALRLYRHLSVFVAENFEHMNIEETENNAALWSLYSDQELVDIHDRLVASLPPEQLFSSVRMMAAALGPQELIGMFGDMQRKAPPEAFAALLDVARPCMDTERWTRLARALGLPPCPGLVHV